MGGWKGERTIERIDKRPMNGHDDDDERDERTEERLADQVEGQRGDETPMGATRYTTDKLKTENI